MDNFDVVVIGAGLGGLLSAVFLAKEGKKVVAIEQNKQIGGCLQTFSFDKKVFDSCVHYIGALEEGQTQNRIFRYAGIMDDLKLKKLDEDCFDELVFGSDITGFPQAQGHQNFIDQLLPFFPKEQKALQQYVQLMEKVGDSFPLYKLRFGNETEKSWIVGREITETLAEITDNKQLQNVLTGNNLLYAGQKGKTPFYIHALVVKSYMDSAYKCKGGSARISKLLWRKLQEYGGLIVTKEKINQLNIENGLVKSAASESGKIFSGRQFIANVHPQKVMEWTDSALIRPVYRNRIHRAENSIAAFMLNIVLKPGKVKYVNHNIYWNKSWDSFSALENNSRNWPGNYALYFGEDKDHEGYADTLAILTYMESSIFEAWENSHNRSAQASERTKAYHDLKHQKAALLMEEVRQRFPELMENIQSLKIATPLTFRDYMGTNDGSMYGIMANVKQPAHVRIPVNTKIENLLLTGQNVGLHGVLGVSISAINTCSAILGAEYMLGKIARD